MKIISNDKNSPFSANSVGAWSRVIVFSASTDEAFNICEWVSNTFADGFVILHSDSKLVAGGYTNNAKGWKAMTTKKGLISVLYSTGKYELRCFDKDAILFALKYGSEGQ